jgi:hypothetical protein
MPSARSYRRPRRVRALGLLAAVLLAGLAPPARANTAAFDGFVRAWIGRDADAVAALTAPDGAGALHLNLLDPRVSGSFQRPQARAALAQYFGRVSQVQLKDVTPAEHRDPVGFQARTYHYSYRAAGSSAVVTRLTVTFKDHGGRWILDSVAERPRPR